MISVRALLQWPTTSHDRAVANARAATVLASRAALERAEVAAYLESLTSQSADRAARARAGGR